MSSDIVVGIDLGTTNSVLAYVNARGQPEVLPNAEGKKITPSVVQIRPHGVLVGEPAKQEVMIEKENTAQFFKRDMGTPTVFEYCGKPYTPTELSAEVLKKLKRDAEGTLGTPIRRAVITVPHYFQDAARVETREAGEKAGLDVVQIINEPTAAAFAYGFKQIQRDEIILVYDLGGGTFDITLVRVSPGAIEVIGTDGNHNLGGKDWDDRLVQHLCDEFRRRHGTDPLDDPYTFQELLTRAEDAKKALSERHKTVVSVNCQGRIDRIEVTREQFESLTRDLLAQTEILITKVLEETHYDHSRVIATLMVGGSTRMPMCGELVKRITGRAPNTTVNPDECVAIGAALQALDYVHTQPAGLTLRRTRIQDVMSHSMGMIAVSADGERYINSVLIPKNRPIPCREVRPYQVRTRERGDSTVSVFVTQGEGEDPANCSYVGKYVTRGITHGDKGLAVLDIAYEYDRSGVVSVSASERSSKAELTVKKERVPDDMSWVFRSPREVARPAHKLVYLAVDLSGSMSGQPLDDARRAVRAFIEKSDLAHMSIGLMSFSDSVSVDQPATQDARLLDRAVDRWAIGGRLGYGNASHPFDELLGRAGRGSGPRYMVLLTDGVWSCQEEAARSAAECANHGIEIIALGFGGADEAFLRRLATSDTAAFYSTSAELASAFGDIAQVLVETEGIGAPVGRGLALRRGR